MNRPAAPLRPLRAAAALLLLAILATEVIAQTWRLTGLRGERLTEADLARGATIVVVWASWSPRGRDVVERTNAMVERWGAEARPIMVNFQEERPEVERFLAGKDARAPVFLDPDGAFSKSYAMATLPGLLIVKDGQVAFRGKLPDDPDKLIADLLK